MPFLRIGIFGFLTAVFSFFSWGLWHQHVVTALRVNSAFVEGTCVVVRTGVDLHETGSDESVQSTVGKRVHGYTCYAVIQYTVSGKSHETSTFDGGDGYYNLRSDAENAIAPFQAGQSYPCWYDPEDPDRVVIVRRQSYAGNFVGFTIATILALGCGSGFLQGIWSGLRNIFAPRDSDPEPDVPLCPNCKRRLKTAEAQQCFECGHDWHKDDEPEQREQPDR